MSYIYIIANNIGTLGGGGRGGANLEGSFWGFCIL